MPHPQVIISPSVERQMMRRVCPVTTLILPLAQVTELGLMTARQEADSPLQLPPRMEGGYEGGKAIK